MIVDACPALFRCYNIERHFDPEYQETMIPSSVNLMPAESADFGDAHAMLIAPWIQCNMDVPDVLMPDRRKSMSSWHCETFQSIQVYA